MWPLTASKHCHMETLPGELTLSGPKSKIPEDDLTGQVRTVDSLAGRAAPQRSREGPSWEKEDWCHQAVTTGVLGGNQTDGNQTDNMSFVRRGF